MEINQHVDQSLDGWVIIKYERPEWTWQQCLQEWKQFNSAVPVVATNEKTRELLIFFGTTTKDESISHIAPEGITFENGWVMV